MSVSGGESYSDYLCIEPFIAEMVGARALSSAFELGVIDALLARPRPESALREGLKLDERGLQLLLGLLRANGVVEEQEGGWGLSAAFRKALTYRDLMVRKLEFAHLVAPDFTELFTPLLAQPQRFFDTARLFELFAYQRCWEAAPENIAATARWVRITTALTHYEAAAALAHYDFGRHRRMLDVGGNSGEFALRACAQHANLRATVLDLPVVCELGRRHVKGEAGGERVEFVAVARGSHETPAGHDLVSFKSMLHDWPEAQMRDFVTRACEALMPGGTLMIYERAPVRVTGTIPYGHLPFALFFRAYREPGVYTELLAQLGMRDIKVRMIALEMPFMLVTASK